MSDPDRELLAVALPTEPVFRPKQAGHGFDLPRRGRPEGHNGWVFSRQGLDVLVAPGVADAVLADAETAIPNETIGLLGGRVMQDVHGVYVLVTQAITAGSDEHQATPGSVTFTAVGGRRLRERMLRRHPEIDIVGWWHSQSASTVYSGVDREEQRTWPQAHHVGLVAAPDADGIPLGAYSGPNSERLECLQVAVRAGSQHEPDPSQAVAATARRGRRRSLLTGAVAMTVVLLLVVSALWAGVTLHSVSSRLDRLDHRLGSRATVVVDGVSRSDGGFAPVPSGADDRGGGGLRAP
jgi:proteasome lid subunit RPN8/RPN11